YPGILAAPRSRRPLAAPGVLPRPAVLPRPGVLPRRGVPAHRAPAPSWERCAGGGTRYASDHGQDARRARGPDRRARGLHLGHAALVIFRRRARRLRAEALAQGMAVQD